MPTSHEYKGKHVKGALRYGIDSRTPRGPERWARAAHNALVNPLSPGAKLYRQRTSVAAEFADFEEAPRPFEHIEVRYGGQSSLIIEAQRKYVTCNMVCAAMQVQLDMGVTRYDQVLAVFENNYRRTYTVSGVEYKVTWATLPYLLDPATLKRAMRCQVCGSTVKKSGSK